MDFITIVLAVLTGLILYTIILAGLVALDNYRIQEKEKEEHNLRKKGEI